MVKYVGMFSLYPISFSSESQDSLSYFSLLKPIPAWNLLETCYTSFFKTMSSPCLCWINRSRRFFFFKGLPSFCPDSMLPLKAAPGQFGPEARAPGLRVWRVEKMKAVPLDPAEVGSFFNGDSYLVLDNRGETGADIHMWLGEIGATSQF